MNLLIEEQNPSFFFFLMYFGSVFTKAPEFELIEGGGLEICSDEMINEGTGEQKPMRLRTSMRDDEKRI